MSTKNILSPYIFVKKVACSNVDMLRVGQISSVACKIVYRWVTMSDIIDFEIATSVAAVTCRVCATENID